MQAEEFTRQGEQHAEAGEHEQAVRCFQRALELDPEQVGALVGQARVAQAAKDWQAALDLWDLLLKRFASVARPVWKKHRAEALLRLDRCDEAADAYSALDEQHPDRPWGCVGLAMTASREGDWKKSLRHWERAFERFPDAVRPGWHAQKQRALVAVGDLDQARSEVRKRHSSAAAQAYFSLVEGEHPDIERSDATGLKFESVLLVSYGRSGSTLLQGILNSIDGVLVRGENQNAFEHLFRMHAGLEQSKRDHLGAILPNQPWFGIGSVREDDVLERFRELARAMLVGEESAQRPIRAYGFKEVRYDTLGDQLPDYLDFLARIFPSPAFVFNTRNLNDVVKSAWWKEEDADLVRSKLRRVEQDFHSYASDRDHCFEITYEDVVSKSATLRSLFEFLGAPYDPERIDTILSTPHSYDPSQQNVRKLLKDF